MGSIADMLSSRMSPEDQAAMQPETYANPLVKKTMGDFLTLPRRAIENSQYSLDSGNYDPSAPVEAAMKVMGGGVGGTGGGTALGSGAIRYKQALAEGKITPTEYEGFMQALGEKPASWNGNNAFPAKADGRVELNLATRTIDNFHKKQQAWQDGTGAAPTPAERAAAMNAFKQKQGAQQYLVTTQPFATE